MEPATQTDMQDIVDVSVALAKIESKLDGVVDRLDKINGSIGRLQDATAKHETELTVLNTEKDMMAKLIKPALIVMAIVVSAMIGHDVDLKTLAEFFK